MNTKRIGRAVLLSAFSIILSAISFWSTPLRAEEPGRAAPILDGWEFVKNSIREKVGEPREIKRSPVFDNLPFLKLKAGDQLIKAKAWNRGGKGGKAHFDEEESYYLLSNGKYHSLRWEVEEKGDKLFLEFGYYSLLFDWDVTLANAKRLVGGIDDSLTLQSFARLKDALRKEFPESLREIGEVKIEAPHIVGNGESKRAVFQGLGFDVRRNIVFKYQFEIGNETHIKYQKNLIVGPRIVERYEFEDLDTLNGEGEDRDFQISANRPFIIPPTPEAAVKARAEYERMEKFQAIVAKFLIKRKTYIPGIQ